jgi:hypothetical protein
LGKLGSTAEVGVQLSFQPRIELLKREKLTNKGEI